MPNSNSRVYAVAIPLAITPSYAAQFISSFADSKKAAQAMRQEMIEHGFISAVGGKILKIKPTDWAITIHNPQLPNSYPLSLFKGYRFQADAEYNADLFRQVLGSAFIVNVMKFNETFVYQCYLNNTTTEQMGGLYA